MEKSYHQIIPRLVYAQMPTEFRDFIESQGYTREMMDADAVKPDFVYHDNIANGAEGHWMHSYKQEIGEDGKVHYCRKPQSGGECLERVQACAINCHNWRQSSESYLMLCHELIIASHYVVDAHTYPHLVKSKVWAKHHMGWELHQAQWIELHQDEIGTIEAEPYKNIYTAFVRDARKMYFPAVRVVENLEKGVDMTKDEKLALARMIAASVKSYWLAITAHFWPKD